MSDHAHGGEEDRGLDSAGPSQAGDPPALRDGGEGADQQPQPAGAETSDGHQHHPGDDGAGPEEEAEGRGHNFHLLAEDEEQLSNLRQTIQTPTTPFTPQPFQSPVLPPWTLGDPCQNCDKPLLPSTAPNAQKKVKLANY